MNSLEKHRQEQEHTTFFAQQKTKKQFRLYYLLRKLRSLKISYNARAKQITPSSCQTENKYVKLLQKEFNFSVQTIIK
jgi:hypothetical protein